MSKTKTPRKTRESKVASEKDAAICTPRANIDTLSSEENQGNNPLYFSNGRNIATLNQEDKGTYICTGRANINTFPQEVNEMLSEAARIVREQYAIAMKGIKAWAKMGLVLIAVRKTFPPRGGFVQWMEGMFPDLSRRTLYNSMQAAEGLVLHSQLTSLEMLRPSDTEIIESLAQSSLGKTRRFLMDQAKIAKNPEAESEARKEVERLFELYPDKKEYWVPLIEAGERTWGDALKGITGAVNSVDEDGERREREPYLPLLEHIKTIPSNIKRIGGSWQAIPQTLHPTIVDSTVELMRFIPADVRQVVMQRLSEEQNA